MMDQMRRALEHIRDSEMARRPDLTKDRYTLEHGNLSIRWNALTYDIETNGELVYRSEPPDTRGDKEPYLVPGDWIGEIERLAVRARSTLQWVTIPS